MKDLQFSESLNNLREDYYALDFDKVILDLSKYFSCVDSVPQFIATRPIYDFHTLSELRLKCKEYTLRSQSTHFAPPKVLASISALLYSVKKRSLKIEEVSQVWLFIYTMIRYKKWLADTQVNLDEKYRSLFSPQSDMIVMLSNKFSRYFDSDGEIIRKHIPELVSIDSKRASIIQQRVGKAKEFIEKNREFCAHTQASIRDERLVIPIKVSYKSAVEGIIHSMSASEQTVFVEIKNLYELNNELELLNLEENNILSKLSIDLSESILTHERILAKYYEEYVEFDLVRAQCEYGSSYNGVFPKIVTPPSQTQSEHVQNSTDIDNLYEEDNEYQIQLLQSIHPYITHFVAIDIKIKTHEPQLVLTGRNAGGKTVVLKTLGLLSLMNQSGIPIPVSHDSSSVFFKDIFLVIGDMQNIAEGESTFSSHIKKINEILPYNIKNFDKNEYYLCLIDEICDGTDEQEGGTLAWAILEYALNYPQFVVLSTTHLSLLKQYAIMKDGVQVASVSEDSTFPYTIFYGSAGSSEARKIAKKVGVKKEILDQQHSLLKEYGNNVSELLSKLHKATKDAETTRLRLRALTEENKLQRRDLLIWEKYLKDKEQRLEKNVLGESSTLLKNTKSMLEKLKIYEKDLSAQIYAYKNKLEEIHREQSNELHHTHDSLTEELQDQSHDFHTTIDELSKDLSDKQQQLEKDLDKRADSLSPIEEGDEVIIHSTNTKGLVTKIMSQNRVAVRVGIVEIELHRNEVKKSEDILNSRYIKDTHSRYKIEDKTSVISDNSSYIVELAQSQEAGASLIEIDVRGKSPEECIATLEGHINKVALSNIHFFTVLHGKGRGVLGKTIHHYLSSYSLVSSFRFADFEDGGTGKTLVELKH